MPNRIFKCIMLGMLLLTSIISVAQTGEELFKSNCNACHTLGQGRLVGPDLKDIGSRRSQEWIDSFILNSQQLISIKDKDAVAVYEEYGKMPMPGFALSKDELAMLSVYMNQNQNTTIQKPGFSVENATTEEIYTGEGYFTGRIALSGGGISCIGCHSINTYSKAKGGTLAKELSNSFNNLGAPGIQSLLKSAPFPAMQVSYKKHPLTDKEIFAITAFMKNANTLVNNSFTKKFGDYFLAFSSLFFCLLLMIIWIVWDKSKIFSTNSQLLKRQLKTR